MQAIKVNLAALRPVDHQPFALKAIKVVSNDKPEEKARSEKSSYMGRNKSSFGNTREKVFETRNTDLQGKISVRLDHRTIIFVDPGADIEAILDKYRSQMGKKM